MNASAHATISAAERPTWRLARAVLVYQPESGTHAGGRAVYATVHAVEHKNGDCRLAQGMPATREACADLARALGAASKLGGFIPPNLLYLGAKSLLWWRPPGPARVFFDTTKDAAGDQANDKTGAGLIGRKSGVVVHPGLVFAVAGGRWYVYALADKQRPHARTQLWRAPYFNVWAEGEICTGNVRLPETLSAASLEAYERAFFDSEFTHPNVRGKEKLIHHADGPYGFWAGLLKRPHDLDFPVLNLAMHKGLNVERLAKRLEKREGGSDE